MKVNEVVSMNGIVVRNKPKSTDAMLQIALSRRPHFRDGRDSRRTRFGLKTLVRQAIR